MFIRNVASTITHIGGCSSYEVDTEIIYGYISVCIEGSCRDLAWPLMDACISTQDEDDIT